VRVPRGTGSPNPSDPGRPHPDLPLPLFGCRVGRNRARQRSPDQASRGNSGTRNRRSNRALPPTTQGAPLRSRGPRDSSHNRNTDLSVVPFRPSRRRELERRRIFPLGSRRRGQSFRRSPQATRPRTTPGTRRCARHSYRPCSNPQQLSSPAQRARRGDPGDRSPLRSRSVGTLTASQVTVKPQKRCRPPPASTPGETTTNSINSGATSSRDTPNQPRRRPIPLKNGNAVPTTPAASVSRRWERQKISCPDPPSRPLITLIPPSSCRTRSPNGIYASRPLGKNLRLAVRGTARPRRP
jgi:hypothetical protein